MQQDFLTKNDALLAVNGLSVAYGRNTVLHEVSFSIRPNEFVGILGHNGAGKTTLLRCLAGLHGQTAGTIHYDGSDLRRQPTPARVDAGLMLVPQGRALFPQMSVEQNVTLGAFRRSVSDAEHAWSESVSKWPWLAQRRKETVKNLSGGQQQIVANARGLAGAPKLLMVDEPSVGLAGIAVSDLAESLLELKGGGLSGILVEQNLGLALSVCDRFLVLRNGRLVGDYDKSDLQKEDLWKLF